MNRGIIMASGYPILPSMTPKDELQPKLHQSSVRCLHFSHAHSSRRNILRNRPRGEGDRGASLFFNRIKSTSFKFPCFLFHFERIDRLGRYSARHRRHIISASDWEHSPFLAAVNLAFLKLTGCVAVGWCPSDEEVARRQCFIIIDVITDRRERSTVKNSLRLDKDSMEYFFG